MLANNDCLVSFLILSVAFLYLLIVDTGIVSLSSPLSLQEVL